MGTHTRDPERKWSQMRSATSGPRLARALSRSIGAASQSSIRGRKRGRSRSRTISGGPGRSRS